MPTHVQNAKCQVCLSKNHKIVSADLNLYQCLDCAHYYSIVELESSEIYNHDYYAEFGKNWYEHPNFPLFKKMLTQIQTQRGHKESFSVLDFGCGKGDLLRYLKEKDPTLSLTGVDFTENSDDSIQYINANFLTHDFNQTFDVIISSEVIEHIEFPDTYLKKIESLLNPNGIVILTTINKSSIIYQLGHFLRAFGVSFLFNRLYHYHHLQHFSGKSLHTLIKRNNFNIINAHNYDIRLKSVDVPSSNWLIQKLYTLIIGSLFLLAKPFNLGMHQWVVCRK